MTPEVVVHRYIELLSPDADFDALLALINADADLLYRWLTVLRCPADPLALRARLAELSPLQRSVIGRGLTGSVHNAARMGFTQWRGLLRSAHIAQAIAEYLELAAADALRARVHLALSGSQLAHDTLLDELVTYRGAAAELLEDADALMQIFAVVDALELQDELTAQRLARELLDLNEESFDAAMQRGGETAQQLLESLGLDEVDLDADWSERLWRQQQVSVLAELAGELNLAEAHPLMSRALFSMAPYLYVVHGRYLQPVGTDDSDGLRVPQDSSRSLIARCFREHEPVVVAADEAASLADQRALRRLASNAAIAVPVATRSAEQAVGVLLFAADDEHESHYAVQLYAEHLGARLELADVTTDHGESLLNRFRELEARRLREIVHEANNPLSIVQNYLHIVELRLADDPVASEQLELVGQELRRAAQIFQSVRQVPQQLNVSQADEMMVSSFDLNVLVRKTVELHRGYAEQHHVDLDTELDRGELVIDSDEERLTQVLTNLLRNSIEACHPGDVVTVATQRGIFRSGVPGVELSIQDTGPGLPEDVLQRLFEPKQSAKGGNHQGLGLHIVDRLLGELRGHVDTRTGAEQGTLFRVFLPVNGAQAAANA